MFVCRDNLLKGWHNRMSCYFSSINYGSIVMLDNERIACMRCWVDAVHPGLIHWPDMIMPTVLLLSDKMGSAQYMSWQELPASAEVHTDAWVGAELDKHVSCCTRICRSKAAIGLCACVHS